MRAHLPGIALEPLVQSAAPGLPPMDVAGFAGFAERGPCHRAIAIDSVASFTALFGEEVTLAAGRDGEPPAVSQLAGAVRGFFANGGRRCWVVRVARTAASEAQWQAETGRTPDTRNMAEAGQFALPGVIQRLPGVAGAASSRLRPAWLAAASVGSWADRMAAQVRITPEPFRLTGCKALPRTPDDGAAGLTSGQLSTFRSLHSGVSFEDPGNLAAGDLVEFSSPDGKIRRFAVAVRRVGSRWHALWAAAFGPVVAAEDEGAVPAQVQFAGNPALHAAHFHRRFRHVTLDAKPERLPAPGSWVEITAAGGIAFMRAEAVGAAMIAGPVWQQIPHRLPAANSSARRISFDLRTALGDDTRQATGLAGGLAAPDSPRALVSDDEWFAPRERRRACQRFPLSLRARDRERLGAAGDAERGAPAFAAAAARMGTLAFTAADRELLRACWLPLGCAETFAEPARAVPLPRRALQRDGLAKFDAGLFLDPAFVSLATDQVAAALTRHRDLAERQLLGLHALFDTPDSAFGTPTILAAPDIAQPGWQLAAAGDPPRPAPLDGEAPPIWLAHAGGCPPLEEEAVRDRPDTARFLDADTRLLAAPVLTGPGTASTTGRVSLSWSGGEAGVPVVLEASTSPDFAAAAIIYTGSDARFAVTGLREGAWYFRLRCTDGTNVSAWSAHAVLVRASQYVVRRGVNPLLPVLQLALLRAAAGSLDAIALLSLPAGLRAAEVAAQVRLLTKVAGDFSRPERLGPGEVRALSYGAVYFGRLLYRAAAGAREALLAAPAEGCIAGQMAQLARSEGAWIAPANRAIADCAGVDPQLSPADRQVLQDARINALGPIVRGFAALDAMTLSGEPEWGQIGVRRLMIFLRLVALCRGEPLVFESNGDRLRRALEREFSQMLGDLQRRGAFASGPQGWRVAVATTHADRDEGRIVAEIGVAPSQPLRFLTFRLVQQGARLTLAEAA